MLGLRLRTVSNHLELHISDVSDGALFKEIGEILRRGLDGAWLEKLDGLDQRYWDLKVGESILTLHLEHYLGIMLFPSPECEGTSDANSLIEKAHQLLSAYADAA